MSGNPVSAGGLKAFLAGNYLETLGIIPAQALLMLTRGELMPGWLLPTLYAVFVEIACYLIITWNERHLHFGIAKLAGSKRAVVFAAVWSATAAVVAYAYPRIEMFANVWNDYLL